MIIFDPLYLLFMIPGLILMLWAQSRVKGTFSKYSKVANHLGITGAQAARQVLNTNGLYDVQIEQTPGELTDHYDPRTKVLRLSPGVYNQASVAAIGVAAHEAGHAIQDAQAYAPLRVRSAIVPAVSIGSNLGFILLFAGIIIGLTELAWLGVALFALGTVFALVTLPVEFAATRRAKATLSNLGLVTREDSQGVASVLNAAAWTYIASFATAVLQLLYYVLLVTGMSRNND
jgi:Zn-dependent membrane protease YugP